MSRPSSSVPPRNPTPMMTNINVAPAPDQELPPPPPDLFTTLPILKDTLITKTSEEQDAVAKKVLPLLSFRSDPLPRLEREEHIKYLRSALASTLPPFMTTLDASRPWLIYWCLTGLAVLGIDVSPYRTRVISTFLPLQNPNGGFGGGNGQFSHLAGTYAAVLSLLSVGNDPETNAPALEIVDRVSMLRWLKSVKQPDGGFSVAVGGETDVRGVYCALVIITLLHLPTSDGLLDGTAEYLMRCQTYEGGFAANPYGSEAHGGYAFCTLAALSLLMSPGEWAKKVDLEGVIRWLSAKQYAPEGGLAGRTNKLVDGCYSHWVGGCWPLVQAALKERDGVESDCWSREGLVRYILAACQSPAGGMRDKPGKAADFYHTCYILLGLCCTQNHYIFAQPALTTPPAFSWSFTPEIPGVTDIVENTPQWPDDVCDPEDPEDMVNDRVLVAHPLFCVLWARVEECEAWGRGKGWI